MQKSFELIAQLLPLIDDFTKNNEQASIEDFLTFAANKNEQTTKQRALGNQQHLSNRLGYYLNMLFRFMKLYTKIALKEREVKSMDDFIFLACIFEAKSIRKTDLIKNNMLEIPSGIEIIKRLVKHGLVSEHNDEEDKRAVKLMITEFGQKELFKIFSEMNKVGETLAGNLSPDEIYQLHTLLEKLAIHHQKTIV
jgi:MarR family transcriptional regulator, lower aerobic nicotinate degradation pathway regulator